jgi:hypothetical protein
MDTDEGDNQDPLSLHKYLYAQANPVNVYDPSGKDGDLISLSITEDIGAGLDSMADVVDVVEEKEAVKEISGAAILALIAIETVDLGEVGRSTSESTNANTLIYRSMMADGLQPKVGNSARMLGIRPNGDLPVGPGNMVSPNTGGMSVALQTPLNLPIFRRPAALFGTGKDPVWGTMAGLLGPSLTLHPDSATHGLVEPSMTMTLSAYEQALAATQPVWINIAPGN